MEQYRINEKSGMEFGLYTLGDHIPNPLTGSRIPARSGFVKSSKRASWRKRQVLMYLRSVKAISNTLQLVLIRLYLVQLHRQRKALNWQALPRC